MLSTSLLSLFLLLPTLALASHNSPLDRRSPVRHHNHVRAARNHEIHVVERSYPGSVEEKLAKRAYGQSLARRAGAGADGTRCRARNSTYTATTSAASTVVTSSTSAVITAASTTALSLAITVAITANSQTSAAASSTTTSTAAAQTSVASSSNRYGSMTPNNNKAGVSAGDSLPWLKDKIGWWYDWSPDPSGDCGSALSVPMLWGGGTADSADASRLAAFKALSSTPAFIIGFEEPDCAAGSGSAGMDVASAIAIWEELMVPKGQSGSLLIGPSMCKQAAESGWLQPFLNGVSRKPDIMNIHINKNSASGIQSDIDHYWNTYGLPIWVTEFACVDDSTGFVPCTNQDEINSFIYSAVEIFETDSRIAGYAYSNGDGLGSVWPMVSNGALTASGSTYLAALSQYH